ncbi:MAG: hypothetical protein CMQ13_03635 [Gammaproteobacteria bacterium]|nr:hypothetical protein [Gammaproteobacteria bacterium]
MSSHKIATFLCVFTVLAACGGGGGGGGGISTGNQQATTNAVSYSYTKLTSLGVGDNVDLVAGSLIYRDSSDGSISYIYGPLDASELSLVIVQNSDGDIGNRFTVNKTFLDTNGERYEPDFDVSWVIELFEEPYSVGNALEEFLYWWSQDGTFNDTTSLTQTDYTALGFGYWADRELLAGYLETEYAAPVLVSVDYGENCFLSSFCSDEDYGEDLIAAVGGDLTAAGDMPTTGLAYMDGRGISLYHTRGVGFTGGSVQHYLAAESDGEIDIDYESKTISGYLTFDAVFSKRTPGLDWPRIEGASAGGFQLDGVINGRTASGTVTWGGEAYGVGSFTGAFFGPDGKEFGGVITARDDLEDEFSQIIAAFVAETN